MQLLIPRDLCTRCGACFAADKNGRLSKDELGFPVLSDEASAEEVQKLRAVCSGENWNYQELLRQVHGPEVSYDPSTPDIGHHLAIHLLTSSDTSMREKGQSGGVSTTLLRFALQEKFISAAVVVRRPKGASGNPFSSEPYIARSAADLEAAAGSKYTVCSTLELIKDLQHSSDSFALSTLPCQTVGFWKLVHGHDPSLKERCKLIIGPYCGYTMEVLAAKELAMARGIQPAKVVSFANREGPFPGETTFTISNGDKKLVDRTAHRILYRMYTPIRCLTCTDYGNELADLSVADCWEQSDGKFKYPEGAAFVIVRTPRGQAFLKRAIAAGVLQSLRTPEEDAADTTKRWEMSFFHRKVRAHNRIRYFQKKGRKVPTLDYPMPAPFQASKVADTIELLSWNIFRARLARKLALRLWLWLAATPKKSIRNFIFEECKKYLFTHQHNQFTKKNLRLSVKAFLKLVREK